jgi:octanoyl-[GcvH]:protein N-octanoyltransferase
MGRLWLHRRSLVPGLLDRRLPRAEESFAYFRSQGYEVHLRSSGGRLVVLDEGVLNVAIAYSGERLPSVEQGFQTMADVLGGAIRSLGLEPLVGEVEGSICAGRYDLSIGGRKVAGLSQRRRRDFALIHAFLLVEGDGRQREALAAAFYHLAWGPEVVRIRRGSMAALAELRGGITMAAAARSLADVLRFL